jgi:hypothetical protein
MLKSEKQQEAAAPAHPVVQKKDWIAELTKKESYIGNIKEFAEGIMPDKPIHLTTD